jgi:hypothetical protein
MKLETYNTEAFKALREEIKLRIETHYKLVLAKFSGVGALFAFFASSLNATPLSPYVACAIFAFIFDVVILENLGHIRFIGNYIKTRVEPASTVTAVRWESDAAQYRRWECFTMHSYFLGTGAIGYCMLIGYFLVGFNPSNKVDFAAFLVSTYFGLYSIFLMWRHLNMPMDSTTQQSPLQ